MNYQQISKIKKYTEKLSRLCEGETIQPFKLIEDGHDAHFETCKQNAYNAGKVQNKAHIAYRERVHVILEDDWIPIVRILEDNMPHRIARLDEMRKSILCHTNPNKKHDSWLEPRDGNLVPNANLSCAINKIADELLQIATASSGKEEKTEQNDTLRQKIWSSIKCFVKEAYRIAMRSFFDSTMNK